MDRRSTLSLWRDYGVPQQDPNAFSLQYKKDTSKDPSKQEGGKLTKLDPEREKTFQSWYGRTAKQLGLDKDPDNYQHYYDYRGFYKEFGDVPMESGQHFTDTYKLPGHPTFSTQSKYASFFNKDKQGYWATMEQGKGVDNFVKLSDSKLPMKKQLGGLLKKGGTIHIKPENKGKFAATKKATGKTTAELKNSKNPLTRKRATFAANAKKWNHKKAEVGAKLNIQGMGQMQDKAPIPARKGLLRK